MRAKKPRPSFLEKRRQRLDLLSTNKQLSTAGSSTGAKSYSAVIDKTSMTTHPTLNMSTPNFTGDIFRRGSLLSSVPKSVEEEPNSGNSTSERRAVPAL